MTPNTQISKILLDVLSGKITPDEANTKLVALMDDHRFTWDDMHNTFCAATGTYEDRFEDWMLQTYPEPQPSKESSASGLYQIDKPILYRCDTEDCNSCAGCQDEPGK